MTTATIVHERREVYRGRVFTLSVDRVTLPTGHTTVMDIVRHPGSVVLLPMPAPDRIVLIRQYRYAVDRYLWELPAGSLAAGEAELTGAARECEEEIGLVPRRLELLGRLLPTPGFCDETMAFYRCHRSGGAGRRFHRASGRRRSDRAADLRPDGGPGDDRARRDHRHEDGGRPGAAALTSGADQIRAASSMVATWIATVSSTRRA